VPGSRPSLRRLASSAPPAPARAASTVGPLIRHRSSPSGARLGASSAASGARRSWLGPSQGSADSVADLLHAPLAQELLDPADGHAPARAAAP
jgi:hypothetical protein